MIISSLSPLSTLYIIEPTSNDKFNKDNFLSHVLKHDSENCSILYDVLCRKIAMMYKMQSFPFNQDSYRLKDVPPNVRQFIIMYNEYITTRTVHNFKKMIHHLEAWEPAYKQIDSIFSANENII
jgi:hypothetical protein